VTSESRRLLLRLVAEQANSASSPRARALEGFSAQSKERPPFLVDVVRPELLGSPELHTCLTALARTLLIQSVFFRRWKTRSETPLLLDGLGRGTGLTELADGLIAA
jgi:hypothetical protein